MMTNDHKNNTRQQCGGRCACREAASAWPLSTGLEDIKRHEVATALYVASNKHNYMRLRGDSSRIVMNTKTVKTNVCTVRAASAWPYGIVLTCIRRPSCSKDVEAGLPSLGPVV